MKIYLFKFYSHLLVRFSVSPSHSLVTSEINQERKVEEKLKEAELEVLKETVSSTSTPSPTPSASPHSNSHSHQQHYVYHQSKPISITPDSIQPIPPFRPRKSKDWVPPDVSYYSVSYSLHLLSVPSCHHRNYVLQIIVFRGNQLII